MNKEDLVARIEKAAIGCKKCRLYRTATRAVPGSGNPRAKIVFVGEAPGFNEDREGLPFVGRAGKLLDDLLDGIGLRRTDVWIGNVIKHRPPENRDPMVDEIRACKPYIIDQIKAIGPQIIVTLGRFAMEVFLPGAKISETHGKLYRVSGRTILPLYHPAAALRSEAVLKDLRSDFKKIVEAMKTKEENVPVFAEGSAKFPNGQIGLF